MNAVEVKNYSFSYDNKTDVLSNISFEVESGTITAVIGLSGCGKSTLCNALCGLIPNCINGSYAGEITVFGVDVTREPLAMTAQTIGLVMQNPDEQLVTTAVEDELAFGPENLALPVDEILRRIENVVELLNMRGLLGQDPAKLSGGQKQLLAIGAVLALEPEVIVLDEPMSHIDAAGREIITVAMKRLKVAGKTVIVVEHNFHTLMFADKWLIMSGGKIAAYDAPEHIMANPDILKRENLNIWC